MTFSFLSSASADTPEHRPPLSGAFIENIWRPASQEPLIVKIDPRSGEVTQTVCTAQPQDVQDAATHAARMFGIWRETPNSLRSDLLAAFANSLEQQSDLAQCLIRQTNGKPAHEAAADVADAVAIFRHYAPLAGNPPDATAVALPSPHHRGIARRMPLGPIGILLSWNCPLVTAARHIAPALAAGCTIVIKPSELSPLADRLYGDIAAEIGLPPGVLGIVCGGAETGRQLVDCPEFARIALTGSPRTGRAVLHALADRLLPADLALSAKSSAIVLDGSDVEHTADLLTEGMFRNAGQSCTALSRILVARPLHRKLAHALSLRAEAIRQTLHDVHPRMGPLSHAVQYERSTAMLRRLIRENAQILTVTSLPGARGLGGYYMPPTLVNEPAFDHPVWTDALLCPLAAIAPFDSVDQAVALANDTAYGTAACVFGPSGAIAQDLAGRLRAGHVWINTAPALYPQSAWSGFAGYDACTTLQFITRAT